MDFQNSLAHGQDTGRKTLCAHVASRPIVGKTGTIYKGNKGKELSLGSISRRAKSSGRTSVYFLLHSCNCNMTSAGFDSRH